MITLFIYSTKIEGEGDDATEDHSATCTVHNILCPLKYIAKMITLFIYSTKIEGEGDDVTEDHSATCTVHVTNLRRHLCFS